MGGITWAYSRESVPVRTVIRGDGVRPPPISDTREYPANPYADSVGVTDRTHD